MANFPKLVDKVIDESDILLLVVDARRIDDSINKELESKIVKKGKTFIYVVNKVDLLTKKEQDNISLFNSVQISAIKHMGTMRLLRKIMELARGESVVVGVIGFPNSGKSTIINALKGRHSASTSPMSGHTKSLQKVRITEKLTLIDTPGVFSYKEKGVEHVIIGAIDAEKLRDPEGTAIEMIEKLNGKIEKFYDVPKKEDAFETLEKIAMNKKILKKGGEPDTVRMAKLIIQQWQKGKIR